MNHKRRRPKHQRAGCLRCKPHKDEREAKPKAPKYVTRLEDCPFCEGGTKPDDQLGMGCAICGHTGKVIVIDAGKVDG